MDEPAGGSYRPPIVVTDEDREIAQAYVNWATGAHPPGTAEQGPGWWKAIADAFVAGWQAHNAYRWDDPGPDEMMPDCSHEVMDAAGTYDTGSGPAPGRGCER